MNLSRIIQNNNAFARESAYATTGWPENREKALRHKPKTLRLHLRDSRDPLFLTYTYSGTMHAEHITSEAGVAV